MVSQVPYHVLCSGALVVHCGDRHTPFAGTGCFKVQLLLGARWIGSLSMVKKASSPEKLVSVVGRLQWMDVIEMIRLLATESPFKEREDTLGQGSETIN